MTDPDLPFGDQLHILPEQALPAWLSLVDNGDGTATLSGTPTVANAGQFLIELAAEDTYHHNGGTALQSFTITVLPCSITLTPAVTSVTCPGGTDGSIQMIVTGATAPISYHWTSGQQTKDLSNISAGNYCLEITDANGCKQSVCVTVNDGIDITPPTIMAPADLNNITSESGKCSAKVDLGTPVTSDQCGVAKVENNAPVDFPVGTTTVTWTVTDNNGLVSTATQQVTVVDLEAPVVKTKNISVQLNSSGTVSVSASQVDNGSIDNCGIQSLSVSPSSFNCTQIGANTVRLTVIDIHGNSSFADAIVTVTAINTTASVTVSPTSQQYSDQVIIAAELEPAIANGGCQAATHVTFRIGSKVVGTLPLQVSGNKLSASTTVTLYETLGGSDYSPGNKTVTATFSGVNAAFNVSSATGNLTITREDARANYTGALFASTSCQTCSNATVSLAATVQDISITGDAAGDNLSGDIRLSKVRFINRDNGAPISGWLTPGLVNSADLRTGTVSFNWIVNIGAADAEQYTVGIEVDGYYVRNQGGDNAVVNVAKPLNDFVTGGGYIIASHSAGTYASDLGTKSNFGFNVKYNKSGKNLQGKLNFIVRRSVSGVLRTYQIKGNVMTSLSIQPGTPAKAIYNGKANITDITNPLAPVALGGNMTLQVEMTDKGEPGTSDTYALTVWNDNGGLAYSSNWNGTRSAEQVIAGGNLQVRGSVAKVSAPGMNAGPMFDQEMAPINRQPVLMVKILPNPSPTRFTLNLSGGSNEPIQLRVTDILGRVVEARKLGAGAQTVQIGESWKNGTYVLELIQGGERKTMQLIKMK